ncbi:MAG: hypothetical protein E6253_00370 [Actinomyces sp.]|nr:hypothetical protein [Actinomycetaceae bacterium]MDU5061597.1 hypothetical protein [Actinomyces sp.]
MTTPLDKLKSTSKTHEKKGAIPMNMWIIKPETAASTIVNVIRDAGSIDPYVKIEKADEGALGVTTAAEATIDGSNSRTSGVTMKTHTVYLPETDSPETLLRELSTMLRWQQTAFITIEQTEDGERWTIRSPKENPRP